MCGQRMKDDLKTDQVLEIVLQLHGDLTIGGFFAIDQHYEKFDAAVIAKVNQLYPAATSIGRREIERVLGIIS
jgi:hypothetical protein